ncbi:MAG: hypothetical protein KGL74_09795, partial [Elusimicrobia bacterium]|nr:hypothetical protein [Elusimicrobiota bacterium]
MNIDVDIQGIGNITDLAAVPGASTGSIALSWTEPYRSAGVAPFSYDIRVSTVGQIANDMVFSTSPALSVFSTSVPPVPGSSSGGGSAGFLVTDLTQGVTYFFAIREKDNTTYNGSWLRTTAPPRNVNNFAVATSTKPPPPAGAAVTDVALSSVTAAWTVVPGATDYVLLASTQPANPPTLVAGSSATTSSTGTVTGLAPNTTYFLFVAACNSGCSAYTAAGSTATLAQPAVSLSTQAISSSTVSLAWDPNGDPPGTQTLVQQSADAVTFTTVFTSTSPGAFLAGLTGATTYYFRVIAVNWSGRQAVPSNVLTVVTPSGPTPSAPAGIAARGGLLNVEVDWTGLPPAQQGVGLLYYTVQRSLNASFGYVTIATTTGTSFTDKPLAAGTTFFYRLFAVDRALTNSAPSAIVSAYAYSERPMEPLGLQVVPSSATVKISWSSTNRFVDGSPFLSTGTPTGDELQGYLVLRSTDLCNPNYVQLSTYSVNTNSLTDATGGLNYYYRLFSFNSVGQSTNVVTLSALGERNYLLDDCVSDMVLDDATAATLNGSANGIGDIRLLRSR